jgi:pyruvate,water dikinase
LLVDPGSFVIDIGSNMAFWEKLLRRRKQSNHSDDLHDRMEAFRSIIERNQRVLELIADAGEKLGGEYIFDSQYLKTFTAQLQQEVRGVVYDLEMLTANAFPDLARSFQRIQSNLQNILADRFIIPRTDYVIPFDRINGEMVDAVGQKMARLAEIGNRLDCRIPAGIVATTWACKTYFEEAGLQSILDEWLKFEATDTTLLREKAEQLQSAILAAPVPQEIQKAIRRGLKKLRKEHSCTTLAVRSSAPGEDGRYSFAGLYTTRLGITFEEAVDAYRHVVSSLFSPVAVIYRRGIGIHPAQAVMAVGFQCMVEPRSGGVLYSLDPTKPEDDAMIISATPGLGKLVVDGTADVDRMVLSRKPPHPLLSSSIGQKSEMLAVMRGKGVGMQEIPSDRRLRLCLEEKEMAQIARAALQIEQYMKRAQDIEWAVDRQGNIIVLQARPLRFISNRGPSRLPISDLPSHHRVLMRSKGTVACRGIGAGPVVIVRENSAPESIPQGAVLVAHASSPRLSAAILKAGAVVTDLGTTTGHLATIAREFRIPMIVDTHDGTSVLKNIINATVDAEDNVVYEGIVSELVHDQLLTRSEIKEGREFLLLRQILRNVAPLSLNDPQSANFKPSNCRSYHDIIRFAHEKAVQCLTEGSCLDTTNTVGPIKQLDLTVPLDLILLDLGGGLKPTDELSGMARIDDVICAPLRPLVQGLLTPGIWSRDPAEMDLDGFMASATRSEFSTVAATPSPQRNLAVVSDRYLHLNLKLGYHFNVIDCFLSSNSNDNFIYFRFAGGVTEMMRRTRRARFLSAILERLDFVTEIKGDLVIGRVKKLASPEMEERLRVLGKLIGFTRQLDVSLRDEISVENCVNQFINDVWTARQ